MKQGASALLIAAVALALGGCGETRLTDMLSGGKPSAAGNMQVQTNQNLAMPPDLRLPQPGAASSEAQVATYDPPADDSMTNENLVEQGRKGSYVIDDDNGDPHIGRQMLQQANIGVQATG